jgi:deoxyribodipyrimidine photolyase-related protein
MPASRRQSGRKRKAEPTAVLLVLGNQLFAKAHLPAPDRVVVFMAEDRELCTYVRHHQQKIVLFLSAMRHYAQMLRDAGYEVDYHALSDDGDEAYEDKLNVLLQARGIASLIHFEVEDKPFEQRIDAFVEAHDLDRERLPSPMFLCSREQFDDYLAQARRPFMAEFYKRERKRLDILMEHDEPVGGQWSFDTENRRKLPKKLALPDVRRQTPDDTTEQVIALVSEEFPVHPGRAEGFWFPVTRDDALGWLDDFLDQRLAAFGPYQDALTQRSQTVFHSVLTPALNLGLITPDEVVERTVAAWSERDLPLQSVEGFLRQIIGWREFIRGIYRHFSEQQESTNHWQHERGLTTAWYEGTTGIAPLDDAIHAVLELGWVHHIPRLMIFGNLMTLCEIHPGAVHDWFMEMFVDSSEWVMGPNVYGMGIFSDGGVFATKPYICGSNYLLKMSDYGKGEWCDTVDGLYWRFVARHEQDFARNPRMAMMTRMLKRLDDERRERIFAAAEEFLDTHTTARA